MMLPSLVQWISSGSSWMSCTSFSRKGIILRRRGRYARLRGAGALSSLSSASEATSDFMVQTESRGKIDAVRAARIAGAAAEQQPGLIKFRDAAASPAIFARRREQYHSART